jgi:hypothetical protein
MDARKRKRSATETDTAAPSGPATARRPKKANRILSDGTRASVSVVKTSLSSVVNKKDSSLPAWLPEALDYCNKVRVLVTLLMKLHIFSSLDKDPVTLPFHLDQNYVSRVSTMVRFGKVRTEWEPEAALKDIATQVISYNEPAQPGLIPCPKLLNDVRSPSLLTGTTISCFLGRMCSTLVSNIEVHVKTHIEDCVNSWFRNQLIALLDQQEYDQMQHHHSIANLKQRLAQTKHQELQQVLTEQAGLVKQAREFAKLLKGGDEEEYKEEMKEETKEEAPKRRQRSPDDLGNAVAFMYSLQKRVGELASQSHRDMKQYSVLPEAAIGITPVTISTEVVKELAKQRALLPFNIALQRASGVTAKKEAKITLQQRNRELRSRADWSEEEIWGAEFDMSKINSLRNNQHHKFDLVIDTDGVYASIHFYQVSFPLFFFVFFPVFSRHFCQFILMTFS